MTCYVELKDTRNQNLYNSLQKKGIAVKELSPLILHSIKPSDCMVFSPARKFTKEEIENMPQGVTIFCGNLEKEHADLLENANIIHKNFMKDDIFVIKNSHLTSEGVLSLMIENTQDSIFDLKILILGCGKLGKTLALLFNKLGLNFAVANYGEIRFNESFYFTSNCYRGDSFMKDLSTFDCIINTIPYVIFSDEKVQRIKAESLFVETASKNCLNREVATHFKYLPAPALPQRFSAKAAAALMEEFILKNITNAEETQK